MDGLAGLLEFAGYFGGSVAVEEVAANGFLLFCQADGWMFECGFGHVFEFAIFAAPVCFEVALGEEPAVDDTDSWYATGFYKVHEVPVTKVEMFGGFVGGEHSVEVVQVVVEFVAAKCHVVVAFLRWPYLQVSDKDILHHDEYITRIWGMASVVRLKNSRMMMVGRQEGRGLEGANQKRSAPFGMGVVRKVCFIAS